MTIYKSTAMVITAAICVISLFIKDKEKSYVSDFCTKNSRYIVMVILTVGAFVRFYNLEALPGGLHVDERAAAYDAWSNMTYGVDRHLKHNPLYLINYGGGQSSLLFYTLMLSYRIFGACNIFSIRFPMALMGTIAILATYKLAEKVYGKVTAVFSALFVAIFPSLIQMSRFSLDCYYMYSFLIIALLAYVVAVEKEKNVNFALSGFLFGISLYTYAISYIVVPVILAFSLIYLLYTKKIKISNIVFLGIPVFILALPLIAMLAVNNGLLPEITTTFFAIPKLKSYRGSEISLNNISSIRVSLKAVLLNDILSYNSSPEHNTMYLMSLPLIFIGFYVSIKDILKAKDRKVYNGKVIVFIRFIACMIPMFVTEEINVNKMNAIYPFFAILAANAADTICKKKSSFTAVVILLYIMHFGFFVADYFNPMKYNKQNMLFYGDMREPLNIIYANAYAEPENIYVVTDDAFYKSYDEVYISLAREINPYYFNENKGNVEYDNFTLKLPVYLDEQGQLVEEFNMNNAYIIQNSFKTETRYYIRDKLDDMDFKKEELDFYTVYYN